MVTEQLARSSERLLQHEPPRFPWGQNAQGTTS